MYLFAKKVLRINNKKISQFCLLILCMRPPLSFAFCFAILLTTSCSTSRRSSTPRNINHLVFLSEYDVPYNKSFQNTIIGGLSGIDYDAVDKVYYTISDDRSERNPARFYKVNIVINQNKIDSVIFLDTKFLKTMLEIYILIHTMILITRRTLKRFAITPGTIHSFGAAKVNA